MKHYLLPSGVDATTLKLPFFLAMEEWVASRMRHGDDDAFFMWQVNPTVIFGRNQVIDKEVDLEYCRRNHIETYRRKSGGGTVFADRSNLMISYITASREPVSTIFSRYSATMACTLRSLGIPASASGRNDLTIEGKKVSGNAFYLTPSGVSIAHGTLLYDTDMAHMASAITPSRSKLESKGVKSVESRITFLKRYTTTPLHEFRRRLEDSLATESVTLTPDDIAEVERISRPYYEPSWIMGRSHGSGIRRQGRVEGVGDIEVHITPDAQGRIKSINLTGDFFPVTDIDTTLLPRLRGAMLSPEGILDSLDGFDLQAAISGLSAEHLVNIIFQ